MEKENQIVIPCTIVGVNPIKSFESEGRTVQYTSLHVRVGTTLLKVKCDPKNTQLLNDATAELDNKVSLVCEVYAGQGLTASIRAIAVEAL